MSQAGGFIGLLLVILLLAVPTLLVNVWSTRRSLRRAFARRHASSSIRREFALGDYDVVLETCRDGFRLNVSDLELQSVFSTPTSKPNQQSAALRFRLDGAESSVVSVDGKPLRIVAHESDWCVIKGRRGAVQLRCSSGKIVATAVPSVVRTFPGATRSDVAVILALVMWDVDLAFRPVSMKVLALLGGRQGWPRPFPNRGWNRYR